MYILLFSFSLFATKIAKEVVSNCCSRWTSLLMTPAAGRLGDGMPKWMSGIFEMRKQISSIFIYASLYIWGEKSILGSSLRCFWLSFPRVIATRSFKFTLSVKWSSAVLFNRGYDLFVNSVYVDQYFLLIHEDVALFCINHCKKKQRS